jgi:predicted small lipoprotein YifL
MKRIILGALLPFLALIALMACGQKGNLFSPEPLPKTIPSPAK